MLISKPFYITGIITQSTTPALTEQSTTPLYTTSTEATTEAPSTTVKVYCRDICHVPCNKSSGSKLFFNTTSCMPEFAKMFNYTTLCECRDGFMKDGEAKTLEQLGFQYNTSMCVEVDSCRPDCILENHTFYEGETLVQDCEICKCVHTLSKELSDMRVVGSSNSSFVMGCRMNPICETTTTKTSTTEGSCLDALDDDSSLIGSVKAEDLVQLEGSGQWAFEKRQNSKRYPVVQYKMMQPVVVSGMSLKLIAKPSASQSSGSEMVKIKVKLSTRKSNETQFLELMDLMNQPKKITFRLIKTKTALTIFSSDSESLDSVEELRVEIVEIIGASSLQMELHILGCTNGKVSVDQV
ncbi:uncharacterized protein [Asterias amurensis]|uniref:uncharacterized protein n=1 Tax=Asterias amurensis TaxID=7602 RepID=UPI003AB3171D